MGSEHAWGRSINWLKLIEDLARESDIDLRMSRHSEVDGRLPVWELEWSVVLSVYLWIDTEVSEDH